MNGNQTIGSMREPPLLTVVVPCFNEQDVLPETAKRLNAVIAGLLARGEIAPRSELLFVDDGSSDGTWDLIESLAANSPNCHGLKLTRNFGHQGAILAGILAAKGDATVTIDADLQDPPETIGAMIASYRSGADVVYGVRDDRSADTAFKRMSARAFYRLMKAMGIDLVFDHADFRLLSSTAINALRQYGETNLFLRGLVPLLGFRQQTVSYRREVRFAGRSKYNLAKMLSFSIDGITSFSVYPLRIITFFGLAVSMLAFAAGMWALAVWLVDAARVPGWTSIVLPMYFLGGIQLLSVGIMGEYLGKSYFEAKRRPRYIVEKSV